MAKKTLTPNDGEIRYPGVKIKLSGTDGNAFAVLGRCKSIALDAGVSREEIDKFLTEAKSGDYENLLATCCRWFKCR